MSNSIRLKLDATVDQNELIPLANTIRANLNNDEYQVGFNRSVNLVELIVHLAKNAADNKEILIVLFKAGLETVKYLAARHKAETVEVTLEVDKKKFTVKGTNTKNVSELVEEFQAQNPTTVENITEQSELTLEAKAGE